jgi:hypothetical protein
MMKSRGWAELLLALLSVGITMAILWTEIPEWKQERILRILKSRWKDGTFSQSTVRKLTEHQEVEIWKFRKAMEAWNRDGE